MNKYSTEERTLIVQWYFESHGSNSETQHSPDFFLWGYLKERVYRNKPRTINDLKRNIEDQIRDISPEMFSNVMQSVLDRATQCKTENDGHLKNIILKN